MSVSKRDDGGSITAAMKLSGTGSFERASLQCLAITLRASSALLCAEHFGSEISICRVLSPLPEFLWPGKKNIQSI